MIPLYYLIAAVSGYLLGSIPFAVIIAKKHGVDIFTAGSGNPGATNVKRILGKGPGNLCFALDVVKGIVASGLPMVWGCMVPASALLLAITGLVAAIVGHSFSVFLKFRGGKGVAVTIGGLAPVMPITLVFGLLAWIGTFYATRIVALASIVFGFVLPVASYFLNGLGPQTWVALAIAIVILVRHQSNIRRLLKGEENAFKKHG